MPTCPAGTSATVPAGQVGTVALPPRRLPKPKHPNPTPDPTPNPTPGPTLGSQPTIPIPIANPAPVLHPTPGSQPMLASDSLAAIAAILPLGAELTRLS